VLHCRDHLLVRWAVISCKAGLTRIVIFFWGNLSDIFIFCLCLKTLIYRASKLIATYIVPTYG